MNNTHAAEAREAIAVQARYWLIEFDAGDLSSADHARFIRWLNASELHWKAYTELLDEWRRWDVLKRLRSEKVDAEVVNKWLRRRNWRRGNRTESLA